MTYTSNGLSRREILLALAAYAPLGCTGRLPSHISFPAEPNGLPLTIDVHTHVFNGSDLQIKEFIRQTAVGRNNSELRLVASLLGGALQWVVWKRAPSARDEMRSIEQFQDASFQRPDAKPRSVAANAYQDGYTRGRQALQQAADAVAKTPDAAILGPTPQSPGAGLGAAIRSLPASYEEYESRQQEPLSVLGSQPHVKGVISFVLHHFNYRFVNALDYLDTYAKLPERHVDLMIASLVDYDWWLAKGRATDTPLSDQIDVMRRVTLLLRGRVHGFAPFCPFREVVTSRDGKDGDSMRLVKRAISEAGFLGVKLYPPMGFAPWGNADLNVWHDKPTLPASAAQPDFGHKLDVAMRRLFEWCLSNDVPIMAHSNHSNGPYEDFEALAGAEHWERALTMFPGLRVSFGHLGDSDIEDHDAALSRSFVDLMTNAAGTRGANVFADSGFFAGVLSRPQAVIDILDKVMGDPATQLLSKRLMYGTDWTMVLPQRNVENYLAEFAGVMREIDRRRELNRQGPVTPAFFAGTAVEFLGLRRGRAGRARLEGFYSRHGMELPGWIGKVDALPPREQTR